MSVLEQICAEKQEHIRVMKAQTPLSELEDSIKNQTLPRGFKQRILKQDEPSLIAEIKKASPSRGLIRENFDPVAIARDYERAGATCLSVLTDEPYFQGRDEYLSQVRQAVSLPVLRKDFMLDPYQIFESRALGADCILLIMAALSDSQAKELYDTARALAMDVLVEAHDRHEVQRALIPLNADMIGINNRNLKTLEVDINISRELSGLIPENIVTVAESGIYTHEELTLLADSGFKAFLVGESLMKQDNIAAAVHQLMGTA